MTDLANLVVHGTWSAHAFFVWAESAAPHPPHRGRRPRVPWHPWAADADAIRAALAHLVPLRTWEDSPADDRIALLPTTPDGPVLPPWLVPTARSDTSPQEPHLALWRVHGVALDALSALDLLVALPVGRSGERRWGSDLLYWGWAAKMVLELLARQRYVPGIVKEGEDYRAAWLPVLTTFSERERLTALARAMPPISRALYIGSDPPTPDAAPAPHALLDEFLHTLTDRAVRDWARLEHGAPSVSGSKVISAWWQALWSDDPSITVSAPGRGELGDLYRAWQEWVAQLQVPVEQDYRLCFRLEAPEDLSASLWTLRYMLQAADDPSLLIEAERVWDAKGDTLRYLDRRFANAQDRMLAGLGLAARTFPPILESLRSACPTSCRLTVDQAYAFLRESAPVLEASGFGVLVPPWWNKPGSRLSVRARMHADPGAIGKGILNLDALVQFDWELALGGQALTRQEFERLAALKTPLVQIRGQWVLLQREDIEAAIAFWEKQRRQRTLGEALTIALGGDQVADGLPVDQVECTGWLQELVDSLRLGERLTELPPPDGFAGTLRPYQQRGYSWLAFLRKWRLGACLADDMGLGKTIQAIALFLWERSAGRDTDAVGPALVICPTSVVGNWKREIQRFAPSLRVMVHHGGDRARADEFVAAAQAHDVVISTYGLTRRDIKDMEQIHWSDVILDEAQNIKNPHAKQSQAVRRLHADNRIALTGTPVENRLSELWSIMHFLNPGLLGSEASFRRRFALPIERYQDADAIRRLRSLTRPFVLRRVKSDPTIIQDLPDKLEMKVYCSLTAEQATLYEAVVRAAMERLENSKDATIERRGIVLGMLTRLKQVCNHPAQFLGDGSELSSRSGKLERLAEMIEEAIDVGDCALVFTQFAEMGHMLQAHLQATLGVEVLFLHGGTPLKRRERMIRRFQQDQDAPPIFVLSLKAGGTGLNLTAANHVFHYDRWWNPAVENQATDRAYRIGQRRDVQVHKLICAGTLEERIDDLIESKLTLADAIVGAGEAWLTELSTDELSELIALRTD